MADSISQQLKYVDVINEYKKKINEISSLQSPLPSSSSHFSSTSAYIKKLEQELQVYMGW